jgi:predicted component of type VI protein secretion system
MNHQDLRELLAQLHTRLSDSKSLDADARKLLTTVLHDIEKVLARNDAEAAPAKPRLEALAVKFEADHPDLASVLRRLIDTLGKAGI